MNTKKANTIDRAIDKRNRAINMEIEQIDVISDVIMRIMSDRDRLRNAGINTGSGGLSIKILGMAEKALRDHLNAIIGNHMRSAI